MCAVIDDTQSHTDLEFSLKQLMFKSPSSVMKNPNIKLFVSNFSFSVVNVFYNVLSVVTVYVLHFSLILACLHGLGLFLFYVLYCI